MRKLFSAVWLFLEYCLPVTFFGIFLFKNFCINRNGSRSFRSRPDIFTVDHFFHRHKQAIGEEGRHVHLLMECYIKHKDPLEKPHLTKKEVFEKTAAEFCHISDVAVDQCFCKEKEWEQNKKKLKIIMQKLKEKKRHGNSTEKWRSVLQIIQV